MNEQTHIEEAINYIKSNITQQISQPALSQTPQSVWMLRGKLHVLHHYCLRLSISEKIKEQVEELLDISATFWKLLSDNQQNLGNLADYTKVRTLAAQAEGLVNLEEIMSGEDTVADIVINSIAFYLNWRSNTLWINSAEKERVTLTKSYFVEIQDKIWKFIKEHSQEHEISLEKMHEIGKRTDLLIRSFYDKRIPTDVQIAFQIQLFVLILRLQIGKLLLDLENLKT